MAEPISIQQLKDASLDAKTLEEAVNGDAVTMVLSRLGESYPTLANALSQIDGKLDSADAQIKQAITDLFQNGGLPATPFATKALMTASALADGKYAMVTDDTVNNGLYVKTAGTWVKSAYDPLTQAKADATVKANTAVNTAGNNADAKIAAALTNTAATFDTLALLKASTLTDGKFALVANDADKASNGHYKKVAGVWTKVNYNPTPREITYKYDNLGNLLHRFTPTAVGKAVSYTGGVVTGANHEARILPVVAGDLMYLLNSIGSTNGAQGSEFRFYASNPFESSTPSIAPTTYSNVPYQGKSFIRVVVPEGATKLVLNTKYNGQVIDWSVRKDVPSTSYALSKYTIVDIDGLDVSPSISPLELKRIHIFGDEVIPTNTVDTIIKETGALVESSIEASAKVATIADMILGGTSARRRDNTTSTVVRPKLDLSETDMVLIMVGSNDAPIISNGDLSSIPLNLNINSWNDLNKFPNTFVGNLAVSIERLQGLYPKMEIKLFSPPYMNLTGQDKAVIESLLPAMEIVANYYGVEFINTTYSSGLSYRFMSAGANQYSIDGKILSTQGAEILNKFIIKNII